MTKENIDKCKNGPRMKHECQDPAVSILRSLEIELPGRPFNLLLYFKYPASRDPFDIKSSSRFF